jgi:hypothetical protein
MSHVDWQIKGREFVNCNCAYGCPCQFNALPTYGDCYGLGVMQIDEGHFSEVKLDGLRTVVMMSWPGAIHEGNGTTQLIIDERADPDQREALLKILRGEETEPGATHWSVFNSTMTTRFDPLFKPIELELDVSARTARATVADMIEMKGEPIRNPVTGETHRARIDLPDGFEYIVAEMGSGTTKATGPIKLDLVDSYGQFNEVHINAYGVVR